MTWWCSANGVAWSWTWRAYPGVWLFVAIIAVTYVWALRVLAPRLGVDRTAVATRRQRLWFASGVVVLWIAADWPVGALGSGYLLSVHQLQYVLFVMVAPPLLYLGTPRWLLRRMVAPPPIRRMVQVVTRPVMAIVVCNVLVITTHLPQIVDGLMASQLGSFTVDMAWLAAGLVLWWPALSPLPELNGLKYGGRILFLLGATLLPTVPAVFFFFADYPIYSTYEFAPPVGLLLPNDDQFVGGAVMKLGSFIVVLVTMTTLFFKWHREADAPQVDLVLPPQEDGVAAGR